MNVWIRKHECSWGGVYAIHDGEVMAFFNKTRPFESNDFPSEHDLDRAVKEGDVIVVEL